MKKIFLGFIVAVSIFSITVPAFAETTLFLANLKIESKPLWDQSSYDVVHHHDDKSDNKKERDFVRAYLTNKFEKHWETMFQIKINDNQGRNKTVFNKNYIKYKVIDPLYIIVGKRKEPFGLQKLVNTKRVLLLERSIISNIFAPERSVGLTFGTSLGKTNFETGVYSQKSTGNSSFAKGSTEVGNTEQQTYAVTGRATFTPFKKHHSLIHLGLAGSFRDFGGNQYQVKNRVESFLTKSIISSGKTPADNLILFGLEAAAQFGPYSLQSEYMQLSAVGSQGAKNANYDGYYIQVGYFLTDGYRVYNHGNFGKIKHLSPNGAWQFMASYSALDAEDHNAGVKVENIALGLRFVNTSVRISANYIITELYGVDAKKADNNYGNVFSLRLKYIF